jgi:hypothetical protein
MYRSKPVNIICAALFIGVLLSCASYFGITALMQTQEAGAGTSSEFGISFSGFSDAFYDNENLVNFVSRCEYIVFRSTGSRDVILGGNDFLFEAGTDETGYNYLEDYLGIGQFTGIELMRLQTYINLRRYAYNNQGVEYLLVVIPNSQTVYSEYMPSYIESISGSTKLSQLTSYLHDMGYDFFFNATDALKAGRMTDNIDQLYNNTENSLNSLGEWYLYSAVCDRLSELYGIEGDRVRRDALWTHINIDDGKALARTIGLSSIIKNRTISLSDSTVIKYSSSEYYGSMVRTVFSDEYKAGKADGPNILLEFTDEWDRIQLMPYFSNTFDEVTYKPNLQFSSLVVSNIKPDVVVQFIHEYELYGIADPDLSQTYSAGKKLEITSFVTAEPIVIAQSQTGETTVCIAGQTESDALITVSGDSIASVSQKAVGSLFFIEVDLGNELTSTVKITAKVNGKSESKAVQLTLRRKEAKVTKTAAVGGNSQLYSSDYSGLSFLTDSQIEAIRSALARKIAKAKELSGKNTEFIYVIVPDKLAVYEDDAPEPLKNLAQTVEKYKEMVKSVRSGAGMKVIDLTEDMKSHKILGRLYYQTGGIWTDTGAYVGYYSLMSEVAKKFSSVRVHTLNDFTPEISEDIGGELVARLGLARIIFSEKFITLKPNFASAVNIEQSGNSFDISKAFISYNSDASLPVAIVMRDEYGTAMLRNMAEHFSKMYVLNEGEYTISDDQIATLQPDFIITIRCNGELS